MIFFFQFFLAGLLLIISSYIGKKSTGFGYEQLMVFNISNVDTGFNLLFRLLTPIVYMIVITTVCYYFGLDRYVNNFYYVIVLFVLFRWIIIIIYGRTKLVKWSVELFFPYC